jgi:CRISPR-associated endoribonuclease Cas6
MISSLILCHSINAGLLPVSNGYLLHSALSLLLESTPAAVALHPKGKERFFTLSPMMPESFWSTQSHPRQKGDFSFECGAPFAFRVSFSDEALYDSFVSRVSGAQITLGGAGFSVTRVSIPGENETSRRFTAEELAEIQPFQGISVDFVLPTGFKSNERQVTFPTPELFFGSIAARMEIVSGDAQDFDRSVFGRVLVGNYDLSSSAVQLKNDQVFRGCVGRVVYSFGNLPERERVFLSQAAALAPFCGVGYKVSQGMGLVRVRPKN